MLPEGYGKDTNIYPISVGAHLIKYFFRFRASCLFWALDIVRAFGARNFDFITISRNHDITIYRDIVIS